MSEWWQKLAVDCPLCGVETTFAGTVEEPGYELQPVILDIGFRSVLATEYVSPRIAAIKLACGCEVPHPPWLLCFPAPGVRPFFKKDHDAVND